MKDNPKDQTVYLGTPLSYVLPGTIDDEDLPVKITPQLPLPAYATYDSATKTFNFAANKTKEVGKQVIQICVSDGFAP